MDHNVPRRRVQPRALAHIHYNSIANADLGTSSEEDTAEARSIAPRDAQNIVAVSLGPPQTHIKSPTTPAGEKAAAIESAGGFFDGPDIPENAELDDDETTDSEEVAKTIDGAADGPDHDLHLEQARLETEKKSAERESERERERGRERETEREKARQRESETEAKTSRERLPSPWKSGPKLYHGTQEDRSAIKQGIRRRAETGPHSANKTEGWRESFMSSLPSLPKHFTFNSPFSFGSHDDPKSSNNNNSGTNPAARPRRSGSLFASFTSTSSSHVRPARNSISGLERYSSPDQASTPVSADVMYEPINDQASRMRQTTRVRSHDTNRLYRSNSDTSLQTFRSGGTLSLSRVPSLGDDSRFEHVSEQVNSRVKAIRDSWQDKNIKLLPSLPNLPSMPNLSSLSQLSLNTLGEMRSGRGVLGTTTPRDKASSETPRHLTSESRRNTHSSGNKTSPHPHLTKAMSTMTGDVIVLGGYRGSILRSAEPPHRQLWVPIKVGLNIRKVDLEVGLNPEDDERAEEKIIPSGMMTHVGPVDISKRLFKRLRASDNAKSGKLRVHDYGYDWRLEPTYLSKRLIEYLEKLPCNQPSTPKEKRGAIVVAHSLGGLITRHAINKRPDLFAGVVYAGTPSTCVNILGPFRNGDDVLLSSRVLTAQVNFTIRTSFALLPLNGRCFFNKETKEEFPVDFFDPQTWIDYRLSPCIARPLPPLSQPNPPTGLAGIMNSVANVLPTRKGSISSRSKQAGNHTVEQASGTLPQPGSMQTSEGDSNTAVARRNIDRNGTDNLASSRRTSSPSSNKDTAAQEQSTSYATAVTIPREDALKYLARVLASVKKFKEDLCFNQAHQDANVYPPAAVIYGKTIPTVYGAHVVSREAIKHADAYDNLAFASGDGVVLARAAMLPEGYEPAKGGIVCSDRGHVTLLGDLEAVGRSLRAIQIARKKGVGMGIEE